ncbi:MAG: hypothetical protein HQL72_09360 [Magnetococcales bacterium]|nr:hypothetical protein [Magnetococcales bacterium]
MNESKIDQAQGLTPEGIQKLEALKAELEGMSLAIQNLEGKDQYEIEGRIRAFQDKEAEIKTFLRELGLLP